MTFEECIELFILTENEKSTYRRAYEMLCEIYGVLEIFNYKNIINYPIFYLSFCNSEFEGGMYYNFYIRMQPTFKNDEGLIGIIMLVFEENKLKTVKVCK